MNFEDAAIQLVRMGFKVFPGKVIPGKGKIPANKGPWNATVSKKQVRVWGKADPDCIPLIDCSDRAGESLAVIDIDMKDGKDGEATLEELKEQGFTLPETLSQKTPSGGRHLIFKTSAPIPNSVGKLGPGLDTRSKGGYIAYYGPFIVKPVAELPDWVREKLGKNSNKLELVPPVEDIDEDQAMIRGVRYLEDEAPLAIEGHGGDATTFRVAARLKDIGLNPNQAWTAMLNHWNERCEPPWSSEELGQKVTNAYNYGQDTAGSHSPEAIFDDDLPEEETKPAVTKTKSRLYFELGSEIKPKFDDSYLVKGMIGKGTLSQVYGHPGSGKTTITGDLALHLAYGMERWQGHKLSPGGVLYFSTESPESIRRRKHAFELNYNLHGKKCLFGLVPCTIDLMNIKSPSEIVALVKEFEEQTGESVSLCVFDTLARAMQGADENSAKDMGVAIKAFDLIREHTDSAVILVHHSGKDISQGARGSSALKGAIDSEFEIKAGMMTHKKQRDMELGPSMPFALKPITLGQDKDGDPITACILATDTEVFSQERDPLSGRIKKAFGFITDIADLTDSLTPTEKGFPVKRIRLRDLREVTRLEDEDIYKNLPRILKALVKSNYIELEDNWINVLAD